MIRAQTHDDLTSGDWHAISLRASEIHYPHATRILEKGQSREQMLFVNEFTVLDWRKLFYGSSPRPQASCNKAAPFPVPEQRRD